MVRQQTLTLLISVRFRLPLPNDIRENITAYYRNQYFKEVVYYVPGKMQRNHGVY